MAAEHTPDTALQVGAELQAWRIRVLDILLAVVSVAATVVVLNSLVHAIQDPSLWPQTTPFLLSYAILLVLTLWRRLDFRIRAWGLLVLGYAVGALYLAILGLLGNGTVFMLALPALGVILLGFRSGLAMAGLSLLLYAVFALLAHLGWMEDWLIIQENTLALSQWLSQGLSFGLLLLGLVLIQSLFSQAQTRALARAQRAANELAEAHAQLRVRSQELDRYARLLEAGTRISQETASLLDRDDLLQRSTHLIAQQLGFDQVTAYLVSDSDQEIVLGAAAKPLSAGESTSRDAAGQVMQSRAPQSVQFDREGQVHHELTLPLLAGGRILGALGVHATQPVPFSEQEMDALQGMADHLAIALENARLFTETQTNLQELDALYRHYTAEAWERFERTAAGLSHQWQSAEGLSGDAWRILSARAKASGTAATSFDEQTRHHLLAVPVKLRELPIGVVGFHRPLEAGPWGQEQIAAIEAVADRLALATENLRLLEETQRRAARDRLIDEIGGRLQGSLDPDTILKTTVQELGRALGAKQVTVGLTRPASGGNGTPPDEAARG